MAVNNSSSHPVPCGWIVRRQNKRLRGELSSTLNVVGSLHAVTISPLPVPRYRSKKIRF